MAAAGIEGCKHSGHSTTAQGLAPRWAALAAIGLQVGNQMLSAVPTAAPKLNRHHPPLACAAGSMGEGWVAALPATLPDPALLAACTGSSLQLQALPVPRVLKLGVQLLTTPGNGLARCGRQRV